MKRIFLFLFLFAAVLTSAQTTVYLRSGGPYGFVPIGASQSTPAVVQTASAHGLNVGDTVDVWGLGATVNGACVGSTVNGIRMVAAVPDSTHFSVTDLSGNNITANGPWCDGSVTGYYPAGATGGGKLTAYTPVAQPRGWLDGPTGTNMRKLAVGTNNGLTSLVVASNVATATTSYNHGINVGDKIGIWASGVTALNNSGKPYTVTAVTSNAFQFTTSGVGNGTYSNSNNTCGPSSNQDCLRISQLAYAGNLWWDAITTKFAIANDGHSYKHLFDGGTIGGGIGPGNYDLPRYWAAESVWSLVDPSNASMRAAAIYCVDTGAQRWNGVSFTANEAVPQGGNDDATDFASYAVYGLSMCYAAARPYLSSSEIQTFASKIYNDIDDPTATCNKTRSQPKNNLLGSGTVQAGSSTSVTLAAADTAVDGYYVNNVVAVSTSDGGTTFGLITAYSSSSKVATVASWSYLTPAAGRPYSIYSTITISSPAQNATATVTGYNTHFTTDVQVGDAITGGNAWIGQSYGVGEEESYVTAVNSDTSLTVINAGHVLATPNTPTIAWEIAQWQAGDCGLKWLQGHWAGSPVLPSQYPGGGGSLVGVHTPWAPQQQSGWGGNNGYTYTAAWMAMDLVLSDDDPRAISHLAKTQEQWWDYAANFAWNYATGFEHSGAGYSMDRNYPDLTLGVMALERSVPTFPMPDLSAWAAGSDTQRVYTSYPDVRYDSGNGQHMARPTRYGTEDSDNTPTSNAGYILGGWHLDPGLILYPGSVQAQRYLQWLKTYTCCIYNSANLWTQVLPWGLIGIDPRIGTADWTQQPTQYLFQKTSQAACLQSGWTCSSGVQGQAVISRTGWSNKGDTHVFFDVRSLFEDHDTQEGGSLRLYKMGHLLQKDSPGVPGDDTLADTAVQNTDTMPMFGGASSFNGGELGTTGIAATAYVARWASANHGSWDTAYGDASSRYAYAMADLSGMYTTTYNRVERHFVHFKKAGTEEIVIQMDDVDLSNAPKQVEEHIHYAQNGETNVDCYSGSGCYAEGNTTCPGAGGCAGLNTSRLVQSLEDGGSTPQDPPRTYGLITQFFSPGSIFVRDDASSYTGSNGHTHRVSICGGSSCGSTVSRFEAVVVHKVASSLSDTTLTAKTLSPDPNWVAVETTDASGAGGKVAAFSRNGMTPFQLNLQTDHPGTAQYLIAGLQSGFTYLVYRSDTATDTFLQAVGSSDNSLYFEAPAGVYMVLPEGLRHLIIRGALPAAQAGAAFSYQFQPSGNTDPLQWKVSTGTLPQGMSLSAAGVLSGSPSQAGTATFTITATSPAAPAVTASASFTLQVLPPALNLNLNGVTGSAAIMRYGRAGLDALQPCTLLISTQPDFSSTVERFTDAGGPSERWYVAGSQTALQPSAAYYAQVSCEADVPAAAITFSTPPAQTQAIGALPVSVVPPPRLPVASVQIQYGASLQLGSVVTVPCPGPCTANIPALPGTVVYLRRVYLDSSARVLAASSISPVATGVQ